MEEFKELIRLSYFSDIAKAIVRETSVKGILNELMAKIGDVFAPLNWSTLLLDKKNDQLEFRVVVGKASEKLLGQRIPAFEGVAGWVVAEVLQRVCRESDAIARFGGDEFLVVMPDTNPEAALLARERLATGIALAATQCPAGQFSVSLGVHAGKDADINSIFIESDKDLYRRKEERNPNAFGEKIMSILDDDA